VFVSSVNRTTCRREHVWPADELQQQNSGRERRAFSSRVCIASAFAGRVSGPGPIRRAVLASCFGRLAGQHNWCGRLAQQGGAISWPMAASISGLTSCAGSVSRPVSLAGHCRRSQQQYGGHCHESFSGGFKRGHTMLSFAVGRMRRTGNLLAIDARPTVVYTTASTLELRKGYQFFSVKIKKLLQKDVTRRIGIRYENEHGKISPFL